MSPKPLGFSKTWGTDALLILLKHFAPHSELKGESHIVVPSQQEGDVILLEWSRNCAYLRLRRLRLRVGVGEAREGRDEWSKGIRFHYASRKRVKARSRG